jgi:hypothetical protein
MKRYSDALIVHGFALFHGALAVLCRVWGISDELILTILTMALSLILCLKYREGIEFTTISIILVNVLGYLLGNGILPLVSRLFDHPLLSPALSTFLTTELMGWGLVFFIRIYTDRNGTQKPAATQTRWLVVAIAAVLLARILIHIIFGSDAFFGGSLKESISSFGENSILLFSLIGLTILFIAYFKKNSGSLTTMDKFLFTALFIVVVSVLSALLVAFGIPFHFPRIFTFDRFIELFLVALIFEILIYSIIYMIDYAVTAGHNAQLERNRANLAKFQYLNLKQQVNPHFLFNSLNILDALVLDSKNEEASMYIHKLAGIYRYMLNTKTEQVVTLRDEMTYVEMYTDLLKVRFQEGFRLTIDIPEADLSLHVVPCSVQLLIENATKHNAVAVERPLTIRIHSDGDVLTVSNSLIPRVTKSPSSGLGLKYIRQQYLDRSGRAISIRQTETEYIVQLPLLI